MLSGLLASARELRNPLTVGYAALLTCWLLAGEAINDAALADPLGRRIVFAINSAGDAAELAVYTFVAAMVGSLLWTSGVARLVRFLSRRAGHPDWDALIREARLTVRNFEEYQVTTYRGPVGGKPSPGDARHRVPSPHGATYLHERVQERERKAAEMSFRVTLAVVLVPVSIALGFEGGGLWWWGLSVVPVVWFDVALMKYTALGTLRRFELQDLESKIGRAEQDLEYATRQLDSARGQGEVEERRRQDLERSQQRVAELEDTRERLLRESSRWLPKTFAWLEGRPEGIV